MRITEETIKSLADKGIRVSFHPESDEEYRHKVWEKEYHDYLNYYDGGDVYADGKFIHFDANGEYEQMIAREHADRRTPYKIDDWYNADTLYVWYGNKGRMILQKVPIKSKGITEDYVLKLIEKNEKSYNGFYGEFTDKINNLLGENRKSFSCYPTTYGIGVWLFYNFKADEQIGIVEKLLKDKGIEYYNEFSDARWVYRFKISKKRENIERL